jgi:prephenate dehydratase/prephenate dehydrogenase
LYLKNSVKTYLIDVLLFTAAQALAQCDNFLRGLGITPVATYDTAGSAKMISEGEGLPERPKCTPENTAAIASDLAGKTYGLNCLGEGIEDDDTNFTRFLLLYRKDVVQYLTKKIPAKTSVVFTLPNTPGALYKALACFASRDIDFSKIESRPTSASLLNFLKFKSQQMGKKARNKADLPRFRYCFYLDFLANQLDENTQNALAHLREQADFVRILGSYPQKSRLVGPVAQDVDRMRHMMVDAKDLSILSDENSQDVQPLTIGIVGFDGFGQLLAAKLSAKHHISCIDPKQDKSIDAQKLGVEYFSNFEMLKFLQTLDVVVFAVPLVDFEDAITSMPLEALKGKLVVEMCNLNAHPKAVLLRTLGSYPEIDLVSMHLMLGPVQAEENPYVTPSWDGRPLIYEKVRIANIPRCEHFLKIFEEARCQMVEMSAEQHDATIADAEFVTHLMGRLLVDKQLLPPTPVVSKEYAALCDVADMMGTDSFDLFFGMFKYNDRAKDHLQKMRDNLSNLERQLAAKEAYLKASNEMKNSDRQRLLTETKLLLQEVVSKGGFLGAAKEPAAEVIKSVLGSSKGTNSKK